MIQALVKLPLVEAAQNVKAISSTSPANLYASPVPLLIASNALLLVALNVYPITGWRTASVRNAKTRHILRMGSVSGAMKHRGDVRSVTREGSVRNVRISMG